MKVWVVLKDIPYEAIDIVGIYSTEQAANTQRDECKRKTPSYEYYYSVEEWEVIDGT